MKALLLNQSHWDSKNKFGLSRTAKSWIQFLILGTLALLSSSCSNSGPYSHLNPAEDEESNAFAFSNESDFDNLLGSPIKGMSCNSYKNIKPLVGTYTSDEHFTLCTDPKNIGHIALYGETGDVNGEICAIPGDHQSSGSSSQFAVFSQPDKATGGSVVLCGSVSHDEPAEFFFRSTRFTPSFNFDSLFVVRKEDVDEMLFCLGYINPTTGEAVPPDFAQCPVFSFGKFR